MLKYHPLKLVVPAFESDLTDLVVDLDRLRRLRLNESTNSATFFELKNLFHMLESIGSTRIEGNHTTIVQYVEEKIADGSQPGESIAEIINVEHAMRFIEDNICDIRIDTSFIQKLHEMTVNRLSPDREGDRCPGQFRRGEVAVSNHIPPGAKDVPALVRELVDWMNRGNRPKYDLLKIAIAHHRFEWIHPFNNGNGRTGRLLTYALLLKKMICENDTHRILNPTAIFCSDRQKYYRMLEQADYGTDEAMLRWCEYVLSGLKEEIIKLDRLLDYAFLKKNILHPAVKIALKSHAIDETDARVMELAIEKQTIRNEDIAALFPRKSRPTVSRIISSLKEKRLLEGETDQSRKYHIRIRDSVLLRGVIKQLGDHGFIPFE
jgi:Fic family protein